VLFRKKIIILIDKRIIKLDYTDYGLYQMEKKYVEGETAVLHSKKKLYIFGFYRDLTRYYTINIIYILELM